MKRQDGLIYKSLSGFYYVWSQGQSYTTKPKGLFRHKNEKPLVGDWVTIEIDASNPESEERLIDIAARRNQLLRPPVANVDVALVVISLVEPDFAYNLLDGYLVSVESYGIHPVIICSKVDLMIEQKGQADTTALLDEIEATYAPADYTVLKTDSLEAIDAYLNETPKDTVHVVMGQSGAGKSTLLNRLIPDLAIETKDISQSLNRGRHTTRDVTLYPSHGSWLADTPGFSAIEFPDIEAEDLAHCFPEISRASASCKFRSCRHKQEPGCQVKAAVEAGDIAASRYNNYLAILERIENRKPNYRS